MGVNDFMMGYLARFGIGGLDVPKFRPADLFDQELTVRASRAPESKKSVPQTATMKPSTTK